MFGKHGMRMECYLLHSGMAIKYFFAVDVYDRHTSVASRHSECFLRVQGSRASTTLALVI